MKCALTSSKLQRTRLREREERSGERVKRESLSGGNVSFSAHSPLSRGRTWRDASAAASETSAPSSASARTCTR